MVTEVPGYVLRERIGVGPTGTVWRGEAVGAPGRIMAIKVVTRANGHAASEALRREGEILDQLSHPSILRLLAVVPTDDGFALVTPYAAGGSLAATLAHGPGGLAAAMVVDVGARLASALATMHGAGIVHGDVKPANVLFDRERQPLLGDVGLTRLHGLAGTVDYLDPDLLDGRAPDARSDLYALGITLYEALAGVPPFAGTTPAQTIAAADRGRFVPLAEHVPGSSALTSVIEAAFARDVDARPSGAHELAGRLEEIRGGIDGAAGGIDGADGPAPHPISLGGRAGVLGAVPTSGRRRGLAATAGEPAPGGSRSVMVSRGRSAPAGGDAERPAARRIPTGLLVAAAVTVLLVPAFVVATAIAGDDATGRAHGNEGSGGEAELRAARRDVAPLCDGLQAPDDGRRILLADVNDRGCSALVVWDGQRLEVIGDDGRSDHYDLGARPEDVLLFGDWTCDGRDAPALYRPGDGRLFTFDELVGAGGRVSAAGEPTGVADGTPSVLSDDAGCDRVEVVS